jgi:tellurite resistance protein
MTTTIASSYTTEQSNTWIRGLVTIAWADGAFEPEEQQLIASLMVDELAAEKSDIEAFAPISPQELAVSLGNHPEQAENFLRTAVMVAIADGVYSFCEDELLYGFAQALGQKTDVLQVLRSTLCVAPEQPTLSATENTVDRNSLVAVDPHLDAKRDVLHPVRDWLDDFKVHDPKVARFLCNMIPAQCPFERDINLFGHKVVHIPPLCKLNPLYEQLVSLRFRALSYLADDCGEDVTRFC